MPEVRRICCPECKEKSTLTNKKLTGHKYTLKGGKFSRYGDSVKEGEKIKYYFCSECKTKWDRDELETIETDLVSVCWTDERTGKKVVRLRKKGTSYKKGKKSNKSYWNKQNNLLKKLREK